MLNNYLGKFIQNTQHSSFKFATTQHELEQYCFNSKNEIVGIYPFSEDADQVEFKPTLTNIKPSKIANLYIGAETLQKQECTYTIALKSWKLLMPKFFC